MTLSLQPLAFKSIEPVHVKPRKGKAAFVSSLLGCRLSTRSTNPKPNPSHPQPFHSNDKRNLVDDILNCLLVANIAVLVLSIVIGFKRFFLR